MKQRFLIDDQAIVHWVSDKRGKRKLVSEIANRLGLNSAVEIGGGREELKNGRHRHYRLWQTQLYIIKTTKYGRVIDWEERPKTHTERTREVPVEIKKRKILLEK